MIDRNRRLSVTRQARMLGISRASVYYIPRPVSEVDLKLMRAMDELHLEYPFAGSRMLRDMLRLLESWLKRNCDFIHCARVAAVVKVVDGLVRDLQHRGESDAHSARTQSVYGGVRETQHQMRRPIIG